MDEQGFEIKRLELKLGRHKFWVESGVVVLVTFLLNLADSKARGAD